MSDHTSAEIFGRIFQMLGKAKEPTADHVELSHKIYAISKDYDFGESQMDCDRELVKLGLARKGVDPEYPDDGETMLYGPVKTKRARS